MSDQYRKALREKAEALDWEWYRNHDSWPVIELYKYSPAGENFGFSVDDDSYLVESVRKYADNFDPDDHVIMWIKAKEPNGGDGIPDVKTLVQDADAIKAMLLELADALEEVVEEDEV